MKTSRLAALAAVFLATGVSAPCALLAQSTNPSIPMGSISAFPVIVQPGTHPTITWNISYPSIVQDYVEVNEPGGSDGGGGDTYISPKTELDVEIRVIGAGVTVSNSNGSNLSFVPTQAQVAQFLETLKDFPPRQKAASYSIDQVVEKLERAAA